MTMTKTETAERAAAIYAALRQLYPRSRRRAPVGIVRNGSAIRVVQCIVCGARESCCNDYPETQRVRRFRADHDAECGAALLAEVSS